MTAATAGRTLKIWQDAGGTVPGVGTIANIIHEDVTINSQYTQIWIKLDVAGKFWWQVSNADVSILNFTAVMYLV